MKIKLNKKNLFNRHINHQDHQQSYYYSSLQQFQQHQEILTQIQKQHKSHTLHGKTKINTSFIQNTPTDNQILLSLLNNNQLVCRLLSDPYFNLCYKIELNKWKGCISVSENKVFLSYEAQEGLKKEIQRIKNKTQQIQNYEKLQQQIIKNTKNQLQKRREWINQQLNLLKIE